MSPRPHPSPQPPPTVSRWGQVRRPSPTAATLHGARGTCGFTDAHTLCTPGSACLGFWKPSPWPLPQPLFDPLHGSALDSVPL